ncbi:MAG: serine/threonine protein kinase, partial [Acidobacteriota bacterium]|nr:serine/threonine protein kinase [Acidobacteriota bacterium]
MTPERWERIKELFEAALEQPPARRGEFLAGACTGDASMHAEVRRLLEHHEDRKEFMGNAPWLPPTEAETLQQGRIFQNGEIVSHRYRVVRFVGRGGMGEVYEAEDQELGGSIAIKTIRPLMASDEHMIARFKKEIQLSRRVVHHNVCRTFDLARHEPGDANGAITFLTMEFLPGDTLSRRIKDKGPFPRSEALPLIRQMAEALNAAHRAGVIHRDFKSGNVMLVPEKDGLRPVITDFGLARGMDPEDHDARSVTAVAGTPGYMAPEVAAGDAATVASDIYALGVVMYEMLMGKRPVQPNARPPEVEARLQRVVMRCLERDPAERFASASALIAALEDKAPLPEPEPASRLW